MKLTKDVARWLKENAYAVKGGEYWFLPDFPDGQVPDKLEIPIKKQSWEKYKTVGAMK